MSRARRVDANQPDIVKLFRRLGARVAITSSAGDGFPDLVVQFVPRNRAVFGLETHLVEVKDPMQPPSKRRLTKAQVEFHSMFRCTIVETKYDVYKLMGVTLDD